MNEEEQLKKALILVRDLRFRAFINKLDPVVVRAALMWALQVDSKVIRDKGLDLLAIDKRAKIIANRLWERFEARKVG